MDAIPTDAADLLYSDLPPMLLAASSDAAMARAERSAIAAGFRVGARLPIEFARQRIEQQIATTALWVELDGDGGEPMEELVSKVSRDVEAGRYAAVISATADLIDPLASFIETSGPEFIIDADDAERAAALAIATASRGLPLNVNDVASDNSAERLRQLSEEVSRIASTLARLSTGPGAPVRALEPVSAGDVPALSVETVRSVIRARRLRARYFREDLFADPAWDMLLDLLQAEIAQLRVPVSSLCIAAAVPATTALRWLKTMVSQGIFVRRADPHDGRRVFVELAPDASHALRRYFAEVGQIAVV
jgi:DNA-binding MarR family transcriptional regulator